MGTVAVVYPLILRAISALGLDPIIRWAAKSTKGLSFLMQVFWNSCCTRLVSTNFSECAEIQVSKVWGHESLGYRRDVVQKLVDYRDQDQNGFPRERLNGESLFLLFFFSFFEILMETSNMS